MTSRIQTIIVKSAIKTTFCIRIDVLREKERSITARHILKCLIYAKYVTMGTIWLMKKNVKSSLRVYMDAQSINLRINALNANQIDT